MIILTTFFLVFALICARNIRYGVYAVIFSMPLYLVRFSIFGIPTTVLEIMIYILFLTWILNFISHFRRRINVCSPSEMLRQGVKNNFYPALAEGSNGFSRFRKNNFILLIGIALLFLGLASSTLHSSDLRTSLGICKGWFFDPLLFFIVFVSVIKEKKHIMSSFVSWSFSGLVVSLVSIFYLLNNELTFDGRLKAFYISPNYLAMYLAPVFLIVLFFILNNLSFLRRQESTATVNSSSRIIWNIKKISNIQYPIFIIILIPLFFTYSYGAFLGIFAGAVWLFYKTYKVYISRLYLLFPQAYLSFLRRQESTVTIYDKLYNKRKIKKQSFFKILALIILIFFISITAIKFNQITNSENRSSFHSRLMIWNVSMEIIKDNPAFGIGPGTFQEIYLSYSKKFDEPYLEWAVTQPHNTFLAFYLQAGLSGFIGFILILVWFLKSSLKHNNIQYPISNILIALIIYILAHGLVDTMYWKNDLSLMFWLVIGLGWCCSSSKE